MDPAIGLTKILNYLEESQEIIDSIKQNNEITFEFEKELTVIAEYQKKLIEVLKDDNIDTVEKNLLLAINSKDVDGLKNLLTSNISPLVEKRKHYLSMYDSILHNSLERIKLLKGEIRYEWFNTWEANENKFDELAGIITSYTNWEYPVLEIFPGSGKMLSKSLAGEPLYIVDWDQYVLDKCSGQFNEYYANKRLMQYVIKKYELYTLPQQSFGFVYCINFLMFEKLEGLIDLAYNVFDCLMPGGVYLFVYNNSNKWWGVQDAVNLGMGLVDSEELESKLREIGYEIVDNISNSKINSHYIICKKPGEIDYIKKSSVLAKIIDKTDD